ncbi:MAG TPA: methylmalonyl-CoA decarboxylase [Candidatus Binataceae bacterium]|jgi:methylmalonyl-CoA decarboxylase|nr:methylmalonyl-CoA decarboxylase [Candidatus Binataceae bacterium]
MSVVKTEFADWIGSIAFDNYDKRNALAADLIAEVIVAFERFKQQGARAVVLRSARAEKVWSAGHDVDELPQADVDPLPYSDPLEQLLRAVKSFPAPVIAMVHGSVWGGACDLVMACDIVIADETSAFAITPAKLGLPYNAVGFLDFMARLPLTVVKEMFFTAEPIPAARAERVGIVNLIVPAAELEARTYAMAKTIASRSPAAIAASKAAILALSEAIAINPGTYEYLNGLRRDVYRGPDYHEGIRAFLEKRPPKF